ncbi:MAG: hypothetical protein ACQETE_08360 [Bacteroidota bacterium]
MLKYLGVVAFLLVMLTSGCDQQEEERTIEIDNNGVSLSERVVIKNEPLSVESNSGDAAIQTVGQNAYRWVAYIQPQEHSGSVLQTTSISYDARYQRTALGYRMGSSDYLGGIDLLKVASTKDTVAQILSMAQISDSEVWDVHMGNQRIYMAEASNDEELTAGRTQASAEYLNVEDEVLSTKGTNRIPLSGQMARTITADSTRVFITTGTNGGASIFNSVLSGSVGSYYMQDARGIDYSLEYVGVLIADTDGDNYGSVAIYSRTNYDFVRFIEFEGRLSESDAGTVQIIGDKILIAAGTGGLKIFSISTGEQLGYIPRPNPLNMGYDDSDVLTNAITAEDDLIFIANKKGGISVVRTSLPIQRYAEGEPIDMTVAGRLELNEIQEITQIEYHHPLLWITDRQNGTYVVRVTRG